MNPTDLSELRDIHLPDAVSWWPPAPGWWILVGLVVAGIFALWLRYRSHYRERAAIRGFQAAASALAGGAEPVLCVQRISMILRRFAMTLEARSPVAGLTGEDWLRFLDSRWTREEFSAGAGRVLIFGPYAPAGRISASDVGALSQLCISWVRAQRPPEQA
jgi:hypothetical protein